MSSFEELIEKIEKNRELAAMEIPENSDPRTLTTRIGHKKRAKQNLQDLFLEYRDHVRENAVFILTKGKQHESFTEIATKEYSCFAVNADEIYNTIADGIDPRNYLNQSATPGLFDMLMSVFNDICDQIGVIGYPAVLFESKYKRMLKSKEDFVGLVKEAFNDKVGADLVGLYAINKVARKAIDSGYSGVTIPVILFTDDKGLTLELESALKRVNPSVFNVSTTKKSTTKSVEGQLIKIRENLS